MNRTVNLYPITTAPGPVQMAFDDVMLEHAERGVASVRFYLWSEPTLSIGYFQKVEERLTNPALAALPWLRRATGGDAILHGDGDITYSLALPADKHWHDGEPWLCRFHHHLQRVFKSFGIATHAVICGEEATLSPTLCFRHHTPGDLLINSVKVVGSAQRKSRGALLQHGAIRLRASQLVPGMPGIQELSDVTLTIQQIQRHVTSPLLDMDHWQSAVMNWTLQDLERAASIETERYRNGAWNLKR